TVASKYGIHYSRAGNGICHQVHIERFGKPGATLLGSDSHTPTGGGIGMMAMGAGGIDVAVAMGGGPFYITYPEIIRVNLNGSLPPWVSAKDIILKVLEILSTKGNVNKVVEYSGNGLQGLTVPERATITNMGAELGVTTSVFPSDSVTRSFLEAQGRAEDWQELQPDTDAEYSRVIDIDLSKLVPLFAAPHSPDNIVTVKSMEGKKVDQVCVGSCTNGSLKDIMTVAAILKGKKVHPSLSLAVAPGSRQVMEMISQNGALAELVSAGARIMETTCGFCIGNGQAPKTEGFSVRTNNRNFEGRSGTKDAGIYLASPETAAVCALKGEVSDPSDLPSNGYPDISMPDKFCIDDSMILAPSENPDSVDVYRGPNIGDPPSNKPLSEEINGIASIKVGDKITTDHIMPAGARLKYRSNVPKYASFVFEGVDPDFYKRAVSFRDSGKANIIVGGQSYGQGSSREHAALCPMYLGVKAVMAKSFERIHTANLINFGILPLVFTDNYNYDQIDTGDELNLIGIREAVSERKAIFVENRTKGYHFKMDYSLSERQRGIILAGGLLNFTRNNGKG
ncbi:MAG: aconitate hydratase, partial [Fibrobacterota bacterium]